MTTKSLVMKMGKTRPGTTVAGLTSAWVWLLLILTLLKARMVIRKILLMAIISSLTCVHTLIHHYHHHHKNLKLTLRKHNHLILSLTSLNNYNKCKYIFA